jgi:hypothetical protein
MKKTSGYVLSCFSPPIMLFTFLLEFMFGLYVIITGKWRQSTLVITGLLLSLGIFQLAEYQVCGHQSIAWMRVGYVGITLLPPLGIHLITLVTKPKHPWVRYVAYLLGAFFVGSFLSEIQSIDSAVCGGNYVLVNTPGVIAGNYFPPYYYSLLALAVVMIGAYAASHEGKQNPVARNLLYWLLTGYASFLIPSGAVYLLSQSARSSLPSIMCGFAIFLAVILTLKVYPLCQKLKI